MIKSIEQAEAALASANAAYLDELRQECERSEGSGAQERRREEHQQLLRDAISQCERDLVETKRHQMQHAEIPKADTAERAATMTDQKQFSVGHVENIIQKSSEIGSNATMVVGIRSAEVSCGCGHKWIANDRSGLRNIIGGAHITCPSCSASELVRTRLLRAS
jgi:hypothetical protein